MTSRKWVVPVGLMAMLVAGFFLVRSLSDDLVYYLYTSEAVEQRADFPDGRRFRLAGIVVPGTISFNADEVVFEVSDGAATVPVRLLGTPPQLFAEDVPVLMEGTWEGDVFESDLLLIRHEEGYEAPDEGNVPES